MSELQAVLFDMDGTLCDTEPAWMAAEFSLADTYGAEWTAEDGLQLVGNELLASGVIIKRRMKLELSPEDIVAALVTSVEASLRTDGVTWRPGAVELLAKCNTAGLLTGLVTMSYRGLVEAVVGALPVGRFDAVVTGEDVVRGKPAPDAYLLAADRLGVEASACVAIEDSPTGAASAEAAGCLVIGVPHQVEIPTGPKRRHLASLAGCTVDDLRALAAQR